MENGKKDFWVLNLNSCLLIAILVVQFLWLILFFSRGDSRGPYTAHVVATGELATVVTDTQTGESWWLFPKGTPAPDGSTNIYKGVLRTSSIQEAKEKWKEIEKLIEEKEKLAEQERAKQKTGRITALIPEGYKVKYIPPSPQLLKILKNKELSTPELLDVLENLSASERLEVLKDLLEIPGPSTEQ